MNQPAKMTAILAMAWVLVPAIAGADENQAAAVNPEAGDVKSRAAGIRHLFSNKPAIAERVRARIESRPKRAQPPAPRGFLLAKIQRGSGTEKADLEKLRRRQLDRIERRAAPNYPVLQPAENEAAGSAHMVDEEAGAQESGGAIRGIVCACVLLTLGLLVLRMRRSRTRPLHRDEKKKARELY